MMCTYFPDYLNVTVRNDEILFVEAADDNLASSPGSKFRILISLGQLFISPGSYKLETHAELARG